jgi:hypothetical protein
MKNHEENADEKMTNESRTRLYRLQQEVHDALRVQHPE